MTGSDHLLSSIPGTDVGEPRHLRLLTITRVADPRSTPPGANGEVGRKLPPVALRVYLGEGVADDCEIDLSPDAVVLAGRTVLADEIVRGWTVVA